LNEGYVFLGPLEFLKAVLPPPESLGENYTGQTSIGGQIKGIKDNAKIIKAKIRSRMRFIGFNFNDISPHFSRALKCLSLNNSHS
jgi:hypothetical protein